MIDHIILRVKDLEKSRAFYDELLKVIEYKIVLGKDDSTVGIGGKSSAGVPFIWASTRAQLIANPLDWSLEVILTCSAGRELTNSVSSRARSVIDPSSSISAPIHVLIAISRLVAVNLRRD